MCPLWSRVASNKYCNTINIILLQTRGNQHLDGRNMERRAGVCNFPVSKTPGNTGNVVVCGVYFKITFLALHSVGFLLLSSCEGEGWKQASGRSKPVRLAIEFDIFAASKFQNRVRSQGRICIHDGTINLLRYIIPVLR